MSTTIPVVQTIMAFHVSRQVNVLRGFSCGLGTSPRYSWICCHEPSRCRVQSVCNHWVPYMSWFHWNEVRATDRIAAICADPVNTGSSSILLYLPGLTETLTLP